MEYYFKKYGDIELHRRMISDRPRTSAFARAIAEVVRPSDRVLDVGTGSGILAMLAARAGAVRVDGVDQSPIALLAHELVRQNGLEDRVEIHQGPAQALELPHQVDLIISEWLGHLAFVEGMLDDVLVARDRHLAPGGRMLPRRVRVHLAPIDDPVLYHDEGPGFWRESIHGLDFTSLEERELSQGRSLQIRVERATMVAPGATLVDLDLATCTADAPFQSGVARFEARRDAVLNGFVAWFTAELSEGVTLDAGPDSPETHWSHTYCPFFPRTVAKGSSLEVRWRIAKDPEEPRYLHFTLGLGNDALTYAIE